MSGLPDTLRGFWQQAAQRYAALSKRERGIMAITLLLAGGFIIFSLAIEPSLLRAQATNKSVAAARTELSRLQAQLGVLKAQNADPDASSRERLARAGSQGKLLTERLATFEARMVPPSRMQAFLEGLLGGNRSIELLALKTLEAEQVGAVAAGKPGEAALAQVARMVRDPGAAAAALAPAAAKAGGDGIYQHGVEIRLAGSYNDLLSYLAELERMPQQVMWNSIRFEVIRYPRNEMTLRVYTLSLDKNWLVL